MKKRFKYFLYGIIYIALVLFFAVMFITTTRADVIKPNNGIEPYQVVKIQLRSLKKNDDPFINAGIEQTWEFAHPKNKKFTGPLEKFKILLNSDSYKMLLNHIDHNIIEVKTTDLRAAYEVTILGKRKNYYKFKWIVEKYELDGPLKNCWLTTGVSQPVSLGSSI